MATELWPGVVGEVRNARESVARVTEAGVRRVLDMQLRQLDYVVEALTDSSGGLKGGDRQGLEGDLRRLQARAKSL
eukprot:CAMPEP_0206215926 /NCGR_PEP_ID=MMETSP0047_2-20121206/2451_1 /ASSEMBLY_ACC=CAM_ASM_000192 /TAXON_ID=195065 /ORGANISM="Chroomonas mesostigmatica_cf, Strain CCMP1168" /LENGTH=75 /DNA_ID=CAMNT_0053638245 /DNA_START=566 /DNA_END=790 /DNA_ORIENTATION=-